MSLARSRLADGRCPTLFWRVRVASSRHPASTSAVHCFQSLGRAPTSLRSDRAPDLTSSVAALPRRVGCDVVTRFRGPAVRSGRLKAAPRNQSARLHTHRSARRFFLTKRSQPHTVSGARVGSAAAQLQEALELARSIENPCSFGDTVNAGRSNPSLQRTLRVRRSHPSLRLKPSGSRTAPWHA
jgi:hypothetical protein